MTQNKKIILSIISIIPIIGIITGIGVKKYMNNKKIEEQKLIEQFKPSMEIFLKTYYDNIDTVTVDKVEKKPLGTELIGYVNGNKELRIFSFIDYIEKDNQLIPVIKNVQANQKVDDMLKEEFKYKVPYLAYELLEQQKAKEKENKE